MIQFKHLLVFGLLTASLPAFSSEIENPIQKGRYSCSVHAYESSIVNAYLDFSGPVLAPGAQIDQIYLGKSKIVRNDGRNAQELNGKALSVQFVSTDDMTHQQQIVIRVQTLQLQAGQVVKLLSPEISSMGVGNPKIAKAALTYFSVNGIDQCLIECVPTH